MSRGKPLAVTIAGAGLMGRWHARYAARTGARVAAVVDPDRAAARALAARFRGAAVFADLEKSLRTCPSSAVHVCTPPASHEASARIALEGGRHVLVEKPLAASTEGAKRLLDLASRGGLALSAVHQFPFQRGASRLALRRAELGEIVRLDFLLCSAGGQGLAPADSRETLLAMLPHPVSLFRVLAGGMPPASDWKILATGSQEISLACGGARPSLGIFLSLRGRPTRCRLDVIGTEATAHLDLFHGFSVIERRRPSRLSKAAAPFRFGIDLFATAAANLSRRAVVREAAYPGLAELIRLFHLSAAGRAAPPVTAEEILAAANLADRVRAEPADRDRTRGAGIIDSKAPGHPS
ncbi:MAG: Gfo/Idh/MocA family oxidoreductase [Acidobacteria bacterium]|nr:Gfo/Idh/MocA family oxidoreductase [Acidobacteriota bacterium]MCA1610972.1 Gfo/Idh/MocA family oxidoreductase [Acidobacteriota bacterium]